jgi:REP element-mobilizing transposase RayT
MLATHLIFGAYGFWLPNNPRGSWSDFVASWDLYRYGGTATKTNETKSLAARPHDQVRRLGAKKYLRRPPVRFNGVQARAVARGFANYSIRAGLEIYACAVLHDHVHLVVSRHRLSPEQLAVQLKGAATRQLIAEGIHPFPTAARRPKCFARGEWKVFFDSDEDVIRAIRYVEENPVKEDLPRQRWSFVIPYRKRAPLPRRG